MEKQDNKAGSPVNEQGGGAAARGSGERPSQNRGEFVPPQIPPELVADAGWRGAFFILLNSPCMRRAASTIWRYFDPVEKSLYIEKMLAARAWSDGEDLMLHAALSLFCYDEKVNLWDMVNRLDDTEFMVVVDAIRYSRLGEGGR